jgi:hypothetical protein
VHCQPVLPLGLGVARKRARSRHRFPIDSSCFRLIFFATAVSQQVFHSELCTTRDSVSRSVCPRSLRILVSSS